MQAVAVVVGGVDEAQDRLPCIHDALCMRMPLPDPPSPRAFVRLVLFQTVFS